jgi:hypothetical protein
VPSHPLCQIGGRHKRHHRHAPCLVQGFGHQGAGIGSDDLLDGVQVEVCDVDARGFLQEGYKERVGGGRAGLTAVLLVGLQGGVTEGRMGESRAHSRIF